MAGPRSERRAELERAATQLFARRGYHAASMEALAQAVGLRRGSLYTHIAGKSELLAATVEHGSEAFNDALDAGLAAAPDDDAVRLRRALSAHIGVVASQPDAAACFLWEWRHLEGSERERAIALRDAYEARIRELLEDGVASGALRADLDTPYATLAFLSLGNWTATWYRPGGRLTPAAVADRLFAVFAEGVVAR